MNIDDLDKFIVMAATENLQRAAELLDCNASMLSKTLKRLEYYFNAPLFDRVGKHIKLNSAGKTLQNKAAQIAIDLKQTKAEVAKQQVNITYRVVSPGLILRSGVVTSILH
ncbi:LysR family transcriptional regulator [uncultured Shewanella sp.]|uniref:LysR family transcriptional regulator n=1 Tax=uncultured Shewanella sp. TaxID=173975 RepID=UPI0026157AF6|nr:LysR family transcriptional regulator [uncultured Shewanella sp.]